MGATLLVTAALGAVFIGCGYTVEVRRLRNLDTAVGAALILLAAGFALYFYA